MALLLTVGIFLVADNCTFPAIALLDVMVSVFPDVLSFTSLLDDVKLNFDRTPLLSVSFSTYCLPSHFSSWGALSVLPDAKLGMVPWLTIPEIIC